MKSFTEVLFDRSSGAVLVLVVLVLVLVVLVLVVLVLVLVVLRAMGLVVAFVAVRGHPEANRRPGPRIPAFSRFRVFQSPRTPVIGSLQRA